MNIKPTNVEEILAQAIKITKAQNQTLAYLQHTDQQGLNKNYTDKNMNISQK